MSGAPPTDLSLSPNFVDENQPIGTPVGQFSTADLDPGDTFRYAFADGYGDNDNRFFTIEGNQLKTNAVFDYEAPGRQPVYSIVVRVTDQEDATFEKRLSIFVENVNEAPGNLTLSPLSVNENQPAGAVIGALSAVDPEGDKSLTYNLVTGNGDADNASFTIEGSKFKTRTLLDYEKQRTYSILVRVADSGGAFRDQVFSIAVNDVNEAPSASEFSYTTSQNTELAIAAPGILEGAKDPEGLRPVAVLVAGSGPEHGVLSLRADGSFVYRPDANYIGSDEFQYQVTGGKLASAPTTVSITVEYGSDPVVQTTTAASGGGNMVLARVQENLLLVNFTTRQVLFNRPMSAVNSLTVQGDDDKPDTLTIDSSVGAPGVLPGGLTFNGGGGWRADTLVLRGSAGADTFTIAADSVTFNSLVVSLDGVEQLVLDGRAGNDTYQISALPVNTTIADGKGVDTLDFSGAPSGVTIDLGKTSPQAIFATGGTLTLKGTIENAIGTESADWIKGNAANNRIDGRGGDDKLFGGARNDVLLGGEGDDQLDAGPGRNLLIGGTGSDTLRGRSGNSILIGGTTDYDHNDAALAEVMREWTSARSFRSRCKRLADTLGLSVSDDGESDELFGGPGNDWFLGLLPPDLVYRADRNDRLG